MRRWVRKVDVIWLGAPPEQVVPLFVKGEFWIDKRSRREIASTGEGARADDRPRHVDARACREGYDRHREGEDSDDRKELRKKPKHAKRKRTHVWLTP